MEQDRGLTIATRVLAYVVGVLFVVLAATGVALTFRYQPTVSYANVASLEHHSIVTLPRRSSPRVAAVRPRGRRPRGFEHRTVHRAPPSFRHYVLAPRRFVRAGRVGDRLPPALGPDVVVGGHRRVPNMRGDSAILHGHKVVSSRARRFHRGRHVDGKAAGLGARPRRVPS